MKKTLELEKLKEQGNKSYKDENYELAIKFYSRAIKYIDEQDGVAGNHDLLIKCLSNRALCYLKASNFVFCVADAQRVIELAPKHIKALHTLGMGLKGQGLIDESLAAFQRCLSTDPNNIDAINQVKELTKKIGSSDIKNESSIPFIDSSHKAMNGHETDVVSRTTTVVKLTFSKDVIGESVPGLHPALRSDYFLMNNTSESVCEGIASSVALRPPPHVQMRDIERLLAQPVNCELHSSNSQFCLLESGFWRDWVKYSQSGSSTDADSVVFPRPITNGCLVESNWWKVSGDNLLVTSSSQLNPDLSCMSATIDILDVDSDCVAVPVAGWRALSDWFGGGPVIACRGSWSDLASVSQSQHRSVKLGDLVIESLVDATKVRAQSAILKSQTAEVVCSVCLSVGSDLRLGAHLTIFNCSRCHKTSYCSKDCQLVHWPFHKSSCSLSTSGTSSQERKLGGLVGFRNIGNSCYLSACLQFLSHIAPLTRLLLSGRHKDDINEHNKDGSGGAVLVKEYVALLKELWLGSQKDVAPTGVKRILGRLNSDYAGFGQHDAHDVLELLLDRMHEDLNRVREKPYAPKPEGDGSNDAAIAKESWRLELARHDSIIGALLGGQLRSKLVCPGCGKVSVSFDAIQTLLLALPAPLPPAQLVRVLLLPLLYAGDDSRRELACYPSRHTLVSLWVTPTSAGGLTGEAVRRAVLHAVSKGSSSRVSVRMLRVSATFGVVINSINDADVILLTADSSGPPGRRSLGSALENGLTLAAAVSPLNSSGEERTPRTTICVSPRLCNDDSNDDLRPAVTGLPVLVSTEKAVTCRDLRRHLAEFLFTSETLPSELAAKLSLTRIDRRGRTMKVGCLLPEEEKDGDQDVCGLRSGLVPNGSRSVGSVFGADAVTRTSGWDNRSVALDVPTEYCGGLRIPLNKDSVLVESDVHGTPPLEKRSLGLSLADCLRHYTKEERLDEANGWFCSACKAHVLAFKTLSLWRLPEVLIIGLKRFEFRDGGASVWGGQRQKLTQLVQFPLEGLDLRPFLGWASDADAAGGTVYDLVSVINHFGRMGYGHYTAVARDWSETGLGATWYCYDDDDVRPCKEKDVMSEAAYVLMYRRRPVLPVK